MNDFLSNMNETMLVGLITGLTTIIAPFIGFFLHRDERDRIRKELEILKTLSPDADIFGVWERRLEQKLRDFALNEWLKSQWWSVYTRYLSLIVLGFLGYWCVLDIRSEGWTWWKVVFVSIIAGAGVYFAVHALYTLFTIAIAQVKSIQQALELRRLEQIYEAQKRKLDDLRKNITDTERINKKAVEIWKQAEKGLANFEATANELTRKHDIPATKVGQDAQLASIAYNGALVHALMGYSREIVLARTNPKDSADQDTAPVINEAFDYFDEWVRENERPTFRRWRDQVSEEDRKTEISFDWEEYKTR